MDKSVDKYVDRLLNEVLTQTCLNLGVGEHVILEEDNQVLKDYIKKATSELNDEKVLNCLMKLKKSKNTNL